MFWRYRGSVALFMAGFLTALSGSENLGTVSLAGAPSHLEREALSSLESKTICGGSQSPSPCGLVNGAEVDLREIEDLAASRIRLESKLIRRGKGGFELWTTPHGLFWVVTDNFDTMLWCLAEQEADLYGDPSMGVHHGDIVLDCGAHFGAFVRKALDRGAKEVIAIEIAPENLECLRRTYAREIGLGKVLVYPRGVWDRDDVLVMQRDAKTWGDHVVDGKGALGPKVKVTTIDRIVKTLALPRVDFIKIDIEGAERNAIAGAKQTLVKFKPRLAIAAYHRPDDGAVLPALVLQLQPNYQVCRRGYGWGNETLMAQ